jgi:hypothetical protein
MTAFAGKQPFRAIKLKGGVAGGGLAMFYILLILGDVI